MKGFALECVSETGWRPPDLIQQDIPDHARGTHVPGMA